MLEFQTPERQALRESTHRFVSREVVPHLQQWEQDGAVPRSLHARAAEAGLLGVGFAEDVGGAGGERREPVQGPTPPSSPTASRCPT